MLGHAMVGSSDQQKCTHSAQACYFNQGISTFRIILQIIFYESLNIHHLTNKDLTSI